MSSKLLPSNATKWERAAADAIDQTSNLAESIELIRGTKITSPLPSFLPYLVYEYGLGELTPYVPSIYSLIKEGVSWQRIRGTLKAVKVGLEWLAYTPLIEEESWQREFWNMFQLKLDRVRDKPEDLARITGIARLSVPMRSVFWRGFSGLDIRPLTFSQSSWSESHYGQHSGVRVETDGPLWSFGRRHERVYSLTRADLTASGDWIEPASYEETALQWGNFTWGSTEETWGADAEDIRARAMATSFLQRSVWVALRRADNSIIGYRRARVARFVEPSVGEYQVLGIKYKSGTTPSRAIYVEAQTYFGEGDGETVASVGLAVDLVPKAPLPPGTMWLTPAQVTTAPTPFGFTPVSVKLGESIRERFISLVRFDAPPVPPSP